MSNINIILSNVNIILSNVNTNGPNIRCRITKKTPNELFQDKFIDNKEISRINNLMLESQKNSNIYKNIYEVGEKILINNNFKIDKKTIKKNNKKIGVWNITGEIVKIYSGGSYKIKIIADENNYFYKNDEYYTNIKCIKKVDEKLWKKLNKDYQKNFEKRIEEIYGNEKLNSEDYEYSSADNSNISNSDFGLVEEYDFIIDELKKYQNYIFIKKKLNNFRF